MNCPNDVLGTPIAAPPVAPLVLPTPPVAAAKGLAVPPSEGKADEGRPNGLVVVAVELVEVEPEVAGLVLVVGLVAPVVGVAVALAPPPIRMPQ
jgi:hypothetical protein